MMRKVVVTEFMSLDGVIEDPGGSEKTRHGGWSLKFWSDDAGKYKFDELLASDALLLGRVTYQGFAAAWPGMAGDGGFGDRMNDLPKYVISTTLDTAAWKNSTVIRGNAADEVAKLKQQSGQDILVFGSGALVRTLLQNNLVDEFHLMVYPIVLGDGKRLFDEVTDMTTLELAATKTFDSGVVLLSYRVTKGETLHG